jgi:hypothetical protein
MQLSEAVRPGHPAVVVVCGLFVLVVVGCLALRRARRPVPPPLGSLTVKELQARRDHETLMKTQDARLSERRKAAELHAEEATAVMPTASTSSATPGQGASRDRPSSRLRPPGNVPLWL